MTQMIDAVTVTREKIYIGAAMLIVADPTLVTSFPGRIESIVSPTTYTLAAGWTQLGPTNEDGVTIRREAELSDGIKVDQRRTALNKGEPTNWMMSAEATLMHTDLATLKIAWEGGDLETIAQGAGEVAQKSLDLDAPGAFTERVAAFIQEDNNTGRIRVIVIRKAVVQVDGTEIVLKSSEATGIPFKLELKADETIAQGYGQFGKIFEED